MPEIILKCGADTANFNQVYFSIGADQTTPVYDFRGATPYHTIAQHLNVLRYDTLYNGVGNRLGIILSYGERVGTSYILQFQIAEDSAYNWRFSTTGNGSYDASSWAWIAPIAVPPDTIYPALTKYIFADFNQGICSAFQCSDKVMTVGQYVNRNNYVDVLGNTQTFPTIEGALANSSSWGPTRDGRIKPDITATGEITLSCIIVSRIASAIQFIPYKVAQDSFHIRDGGTSSASPVIAGVAALYLQKNPTASWLDIKDHLMHCAKHDSFTGTNLPNNSWGYGKVDAFTALVGCGFVGVEEHKSATELYCYPNPFVQSTTIYFDERKRDSQLIITDAMGRLVKQYLIPANTNEIRLSNLHLNKGVYYYSITHDDGGVVGKKMVLM